MNIEKKSFAVIVKFQISKNFSIFLMNEKEVNVVNNNKQGNIQFQHSFCTINN